MKTTFEYIGFGRVSEKPILWKCVNLQSGQRLGEVRWNGAWRQPVFQASEYTEFSAGCLTDIGAFLTELRKEILAKK